MIRQSHYGDVISESRGAASDSNSSILSPSTDITTVILSTYTPVHLVPNYSDYWGPGDSNTAHYVRELQFLNDSFIINLVIKLVQN